MRLFILIAVPALALGMTDRAKAGPTWNAAADFDAGYASGSNPNGAWSYGWSSNLGSTLNLYTDHSTFTYPGYPNTFEAWRDFSHIEGATPLVYKNVGALYQDSNIVVPAGGLMLHGGGPTGGNDYSNVVWTAPSAGTYSLNTTFTGSQTSVGNYQTYVHVLLNGVAQSSKYLNAEGQTSTYNAVLTLNAGDQLTFAVGIQGTGLHGETTQLDAIITSAVPEPSALASAMIGGLGGIAFLCRRRKTVLD